MKLIFNPKKDMVKTTFKGVDVVAKISGVIEATFDEGAVKSDISVECVFENFVIPEEVVQKIEEEFANAIERMCVCLVNIEEILRDILYKYKDYFELIKVCEGETEKCKRFSIENVLQKSGNVRIVINEAKLLVCYSDNGKIKDIFIDKLEVITNNEELLDELELGVILRVYLTRKLKNKLVNKTNVVKAFDGFLDYALSLLKVCKN